MEHRSIPIEDAKAKGAMSLFGEKYGDKVRMIEFGNSRELCGGTHVQNSAFVHCFRITSESAIAAGIRRIEAITGRAALADYKAKVGAVNNLRIALNTTGDLTHAVTALLEERKRLENALAVYRQKEVANLRNRIRSDFKLRNGYQFCALPTSLSAQELKDVSFQIRAEMNVPFVLLLTSDLDGKPFLSLMVSEELLSQGISPANVAVKELSSYIKGGGGGQAFYATAGGSYIAGLPDVLRHSAELFA